MMFLTVMTILYISSIQAQNNACRRLYSYPLRSSKDCYHNPDVPATTPEIIINHGLDVKKYEVSTPLGYIMTMYRILSKSDSKNKQPLFLLPGLMCDCSSFVFAGNKSLAILLAKEGYDVFLGDYIGSIYSHKHKNLTNKDKEYWNVNFDIVAKDMVVAYLQKVAEISGKSGEIVYIGHSKGYILALMYLFNNPNDQLLKGVIGMSPIAYQDPIFYMRLGFQVARLLERLLPLFKMYAIFQDPEMATSAFQTICPYIPHVCYLLVVMVSGRSDQFLPDDLLNMYAHFPSTLPLGEMEHERQLVNTGKLQMYDYGARNNRRMYNQTTPPIYDLGKIYKPVYLIYAENDVVVTPKKVKEQLNDLGSQQKGMYRAPRSKDKSEWAHIDFLYGKEIPDELFPIVKGRIEAMK